MRNLAKDLQHALRLMRRSPGFTAVAVVTLAIGIGANTVLFSAIDALLLRRLPYPHADRLYMPTLTLVRGAAKEPEPIMYWSYPKYQTFLKTQELFEDIGGFTDSDMNLTGMGKPERLLAELATASYFPILGATPAAGRTFSAEEDKPDGPAVAIVGHALWRRAFGGDPSIVGRTLQLNGKAVTVVGVAPAGFRGLSGTAEIWVPIAMAPKFLHPKMLEMPNAHWFMAVGRLKPGASLAAMEQLGAVIEAAHPSPSSGDKWGAKTVPLDEARSDPKLRTSVLVLFGAVALVLLIGCVNLAHLTLSRAAARRQEIAVRLALGATRGRVIRQLVTESALLSLIGGTIGLLLAMWGLDVLGALRPESIESIGLSTTQINDLEGAKLNAAVLCYTFGLSLVAGLLFGVAPAFRATRLDLHTELKESGANVSQRLPARGFLAATEIAFALVLLVGAGLLLRGLGRLTSVDLGVRTDHVLTFRFDRTAREDDTNLAFMERLKERLAAVPGAESVSGDICAPTQGRCDGTVVIQIEGHAKYPEGSEPSIGVHFVDPNYFRTLGIPLSRGRTFTRADRKGARQVIVINEAAARALFPGEDPIGKRMHAGYGADEDMSEIIGVVGDVRYRSPDQEIESVLYVSALQQTPRSGIIFARTQGEPTAFIGAMREAVASVDPDLPIYSARSLEEVTRAATSRPRFAAVLLSGFAGIALLLAALGVYGVMATTVAQRRREIGIRMALGADVGRVMGLLLRQGAWITAAGLGAGLAGALAISEVLTSLLYGVSARDPATYAGVAALLGGVALAACWLAARRAARVQPLEALRNE